MGCWGQRILAYKAAMAIEKVLEFLQTGTARVVLLLAALAMLGAVGWYVIGKIRGQVRQSGLDANQFMTKFRDLHDQGDLSDEEFRTIKSMLSERLQQQLKEQLEQQIKDQGKKA